MIHFTFDDNNTSDLWAANVLKHYGLVGAFFLTDQPGIEYDVEALLALGMVVGNHTAQHTRLVSLPDDEVIEAVIPFNEKLKKLGASGEYFAYPFSSGGSAIINQTFKYIYRGHKNEEPDSNGEISRVTVTKKTLEEVLQYTKPLQLHAIGTSDWTSISRDWFIALCEQRAKLEHGTR